MVYLKDWFVWSRWVRETDILKNDTWQERGGHTINEQLHPHTLTPSHMHRHTSLEGLKYESAIFDFTNSVQQLKDAN